MNFTSLFKEITGEDFGVISCEELSRFESTTWLSLFMNGVEGDSPSIFQKCLDICNRSPNDFSEIRSCLNKQKMDLLLSCFLAAAFPPDINQNVECSNKQTKAGSNQGQNRQVQTKLIKQPTSMYSGFNSEQMTGLSQQRNFGSTTNAIRDKTKNDALKLTSTYNVRTTVDNSDRKKCVGKNSVTNLNRDMYNPSTIPGPMIIDDDINNVKLKNKNVDSLNPISEIFEKRNNNSMTKDVSNINDNGDDRIIVWKRPQDNTQTNSSDDKSANQNFYAINFHTGAKNISKTLETYKEKQKTVNQQPRIDDSFIDEAEYCTNISIMIPNYNDRRMPNISEDYVKENLYPNLEKFMELVRCGDILIQFYATLEAEKILPKDADVELFRPIIQYCVSDLILGMLAKSLNLQDKFTLLIDENESKYGNYVRAFVGGYYMITGHNEAHMLIKQLLLNLLKKSVSEISRFTTGERLNLTEIYECYKFDAYTSSDEHATLTGTAPELFFRWTLAHYRSIPQYYCRKVNGLTLAKVHIGNGVYAEDLDSDWNTAVGNAFRNAYKKTGLPSFKQANNDKKLPYRIESTVTKTTSNNSRMYHD
ncbi:17127_t:CDS:2 [Cetraspora pellucida]|uniref:17127_t:CDS:1 n=1 Tax=Cetraspora pellucida TaxID=1433469 RepID=A0A9N9IUX4_9GLOM|nr:17127_t:CDS:2 [Cetraspora pellucida]